jgi:hypothetical protein
MKAITFGALVFAAVVSFGIPVQAQSSTTSTQEGEASSLAGTSLVGVDNRNSQNDFANFFGAIQPENTQSSGTQQNSTTPVQFNETLTLPDTPVFLQPAQQNISGNDGVQVQVDLSGLDRPTKK